jgi:salicylate hydroxylase
MSNLRVIVIGAGIGGCAAALALQRVGCRVDVYEQAQEKTELGAGIQISPNASRLLQRYGLGAELESVAVKPVAVEARRWQDGKILSREDLGESVATMYGAPYYHIHRADLLRILSAPISNDALHLAKHCVRIVENGQTVRAEFQDGTYAEADVLVGADGIHSVVREHLFGKGLPRFSGNVAYRGLVPAERVAGLGIEFKSTNWMGPRGHFVHYYVSSGRYLNFVAVTEQSNWTHESWTDRADLAEVHGYYENWHPQIHGILDGVEATFKWALFDREPLNAWSKGRVTLLGDACHPMLPYMAQGAAQAIEDGAALAACLQEGHSQEVADLLRQYEAIRQPRTAAIQALARRNSTIFHLPDGPDQQERDTRMAAMRSKRNPSGISSARAMIFGHDAEVLPPR